MKIQSTCFFLLAFIVSYKCTSQTLQRPAGSGFIGLGAYSTIHHDVFSFTTNQASLAQSHSAAAGLYGERRFLLNELSSYMLAAALPTSSGNFGFKAGYFGSRSYNESQLGLAYARKVGAKIDIGAQFNYNGIQIAGYGSAAAISFEVGAIMHLSDKLNAGIHVNNPVGGKFAKSQEKLPSVFSMGFGYDASEKFFLSAAIEKEEDQPVNVNAGLQYKFIPQLSAKLGISTASSSAWMGFGLSLKLFRLDVTAVYHQQLGITPGLLLLFNLKKEEN